MIDDGDAVGQRVGFLQVMSGEQNGFAAVDHAANFVPQHAARFYVEADGGFVEKKQVGIAADGEREQHALPLAAGEIAELAVAEFLETGGGQDFRQRQRLLVIRGEQIDVLADA